MINTKQYFEDIALSNGWSYVYGRSDDGMIESTDFSMTNLNAPFFLFINEISDSASVIDNGNNESVKIEYFLFKRSLNYNDTTAYKYDEYVYPCKVAFKDILIAVSCRYYNVTGKSSYNVYDALELGFTGIGGEFTMQEV